MIGSSVALGLILQVAGSGSGFLGPDELKTEPCIAAAQAVRVELGRFTLEIPFSDLKRLKAAGRPEAPVGCRTPLPVDDILISTPTGFRGNLTYRATTITTADTARIADVLRQFSTKPSCEIRETARVCRVRPNPLAPVTTFVFAADAGENLPDGVPAYQRCVGEGPAEVCKIQGLEPSGYQYEAAVEYSQDAGTIRGRHALARAKWARFLRDAARHATTPP